MPDEIEELPEGDTFDRAYVEKLRDENAKWRTKVRHYEAGFDGFNEGEQEYLLEVISTLSSDQEAGALELRGIAQNLLGDKFLDGVEGLPEKEAAVADDDDDNDDEDVDVADKKIKSGDLTAEELQRILDERDAAKEQTAAEKQQAAADDAMVEEVFAEIEAAGFERGTEAFQTALSLGASLAQSGKDVVFADIASKIRAFHDIPEPAAEDAPAAEEEKDGSGNEFAKTATVGGSGGAGEVMKDWVAEAKDAGVNPMDAARDRAEARLGNV